MANKSANPRNSGYLPDSARHSVQSQPRVRQEHSAEYEDLRIDAGEGDTYSRIATDAYLNSDAIRSVRKRRKRKKVLTIVAVSLLVVLLVGAGAAFALVTKISSNLTDGLDSSLFDVLTPTDTPEDPFYMLLLGVDGSLERDESGEFGGSYRSDSMMLARIDPQNNKVTLLSIPRDTKVELGEYGTNKINAAHAFGGPTLAVEAVSALTGVSISHYAEVNFDGFSQIVDALGGVEVDVPIEIDDSLAGGHVDAGYQTLNGEQALILVRSRHSYDDYGDGDLYRAANQRLVLSAVAQKLLACDALTIANTVRALSECVTTDMGIDQIIAIAQSMRGIDASNDIYTATIPSESEYIDEVWYEIVDETALKKMIKRIDAGLAPTEEDEIDDATGTILATAGTGSAATQNTYSVDRSDTIRIRNGNGTDGVCADAEVILKEMGYRNFDTGNADNFNYPNTLVIYKEDKKADYASQIVEALGVGQALKDDGTYLFDSDFLIVIGADWAL